MANDYVVLDLEKPTQTLVNLKNNFQGRVGDSRAYCKLWIKSNGMPFDLTKNGRTVGFSGVDPDGDKWNAVGWAAADQPGDNAQVGKVTYYFPSGMFRVEGDWDKDSTFFYVDDNKKDMHVSTINVWLHILANQVEMGISAEPFKTDLDKAVDEVRSYVSQKRTEINSLFEELNSDVLQMKIKSLNDTVQNYINLIKQNAIPTRDEMNSYVDSLFLASETNHDLNELKDPQKTFMVDDGTTNSPTGKWGLLRVLGNGNNWVGQFFLDDQQNLWVRYYGSGGWSEWREQTAWN